jgi:hypothetical protein
MACKKKLRIEKMPAAMPAAAATIARAETIAKIRIGRLIFSLGGPAIGNSGSDAGAGIGEGTGLSIFS